MEQQAPASPELFSIAQLAEELGITHRAIRFYEAKGLISPQRLGTTRVFSRRDRARLLLVLRGIRLGFTLAEVAEYLDLYDADRSKREQIRLLLDKVRQRIAALEAQRRDLEQALAELHDIATQAQTALAPSNRNTGAARRQ
jgi:DNA-binding transcriptional MerR regulator